MRKTMKMKLTAILGASALLMVGGAFVTANNTTAKAEDATPSLSFKAGNVEFGDDVYTLFAVDAQNVGEAEVQVLLWEDNAPAEYSVANAEVTLNSVGPVTVNGTDCLKYKYEGLSAQEMTDDLYVCAYANVNGTDVYSKPLKYSVLQYAYNKLGWAKDGKASTNAQYQDLLKAMLNYGGAVQTYKGYNTNRLARGERTFTYVELSHAKFADGFNEGLYPPNEDVVVTIEEGYKLSVNAGSAFTDNGDGTATLTVPANNLITENEFVTEDTVEEEIKYEYAEREYIIANYSAGAQYAKNEEHVLDENVVITTTECHFTSELRMYSSDAHNGYAIISSQNIIAGITVDAGDNSGTLNVYGSTDGINWTENTIGTISVTSNYGDLHTLEIPETFKYTHLKLDVAGSQAIRIKSIVLKTYEKAASDEEKVAVAKDKFALNFTEIAGAATKELPTTAENETTVAWSLTENANATLTDNVLTTTNPVEDTTLTLTATFTLNEATATKEFTIALKHVLTDEEKLEPIVNLFDLDFVEIIGAASKTLPNSSEGATITWALAENDNAELNGYELTTTNPAEDTTLTLTATFALGEATKEKVFTIALLYLDETDDKAIVEAALAEIEIAEEDRVFTGDATLTLPTTTDDRVTVEWSVDAEDVASIADGVLTMTNPSKDTSFTLTVTVSLNDETASNRFTITLKKEAVAAEPTELAVFEFGANGSASHKDGSTAKTTYSETAGQYTLNITGGDKMYPSSYDAKGNSCLKFGTSSAIGKCSFTVPENVTKVVIYVAKYKTNATKISINSGTAQTLTKNSNDGDYDAIEIDTTTNKTVNFATVSGGVRAMLNTIKFIGFAS